MGLPYFHEKFIKPLILSKKFPVIVEVGVEYGDHSRMMMHDCVFRLGQWIGVDPCPGKKAQRMLKLHARGRLIRQPSLEALPRLAADKVQADIVTLDGDHNYYTVLNELKLAAHILKPDGVIFGHDVQWPYGRRDLYYDPSRIPAPWLHSYAKKGMVQGQSALAEEGGLNTHLFNALHEGGPKNGVLTAFEDFVAEQPGQWKLEVIQEEYGLAILSRRPQSKAARPLLPMPAKAELSRDF